MPGPAAISLYMTANTVANADAPSFAADIAGSNHGWLSLNAPALALQTAGWNVGQLVADRNCQMDFGAEVSRTSTNPVWQVAGTGLTGSLANSGFGDCWVYGPLIGQFLGGKWEITQSVYARANAGNQAGHFVYRIEKAFNGATSSVALISSSLLNVSSSNSGVLTTTTVRRLCTASYSLPAFTMNNEYLLFQTHWRITAAGGNNNSTVDWIIGAASASIKTSPFEDYQQNCLLLDEFND